MPVTKNNVLLTNTELIFELKSTGNGDCGTEMNGDVFIEWLKNIVLPSLYFVCLITDNASYRNAVSQEDQIPTSSSSKDAIK